MILTNKKIRKTLHKSHFIFALIALMIISFSFSCQKGEQVAVSPENSDEQLILAIQNAANKQDINITQLPSASKTTLNQDYSENYVDDAKMAPQLGYEVGMRKEMGTYIDTRSQAYFDLNGRELMQDGGRGGHHHGHKKGKKHRKECFKLVHPVTFIMPDGTTITGEDEKEVRTAIKTWYENNPNFTERPELQFPVDVILEDGTTLTINNDDEMKELIEGCGNFDRGGDREPCFEFVYPITHIMPDGSEITLETREDHEAIKNWYDANPDVKDRPDLKYPVDVILKDGTTVTILDDDEMRQLKEECRDDHRGGKRNGEPCFEFVYPISHIMPDGSKIILETKEDREAIKAWYDANPDVKDKPALKFPVDLILQDGTTVTVNNEDEMREIHDGCDHNRGHGKHRKP